MPANNAPLEDTTPELRQLSLKEKSAQQARAIAFAYLALLISPLFFSTNVVFGRAANDIAPFLLAFLRWSATSAILWIICHKHWSAMIAIAKAQWRSLLLLGFLGMFICGGVVYLALQQTTATNGTLIYTIPPVLILLIERFWRGRLLRWREMIGVALAILGVIVIVAKGRMENLLALDFNPGDLLFLLAAISWAIYSVILKAAKFNSLNTLSLFALVAAFGSATLLPIALFEWFQGEHLPSTGKHWSIITGIIVLSSLIAFSTFQHGVKVIGASTASIFLYLLPPFGVGFAWFFLGETLARFHFVGIATILCGVILATLPNRRRKKPLVI